MQTSGSTSGPWTTILVTVPIIIILNILERHVWFRQCREWGPRSDGCKAVTIYMYWFIGISHICQVNHYCNMKIWTVFTTLYCIIKIYYNLLQIYGAKNVGFCLQNLSFMLHIVQFKNKDNRRQLDSRKKWVYTIEIHVDGHHVYVHLPLCLIRHYWYF